MTTAAQYRAETRRVTREREAADKARLKATEWGLFQWRADGHYWRAGAIKIYKTQAGAEKAATKLYNTDRSSSIVARPLAD